MPAGLQGLQAIGPLRASRAKLSKRLSRTMREVSTTRALVTAPDFDDFGVIGLTLDTDRITGPSTSYQPC